MSRRSRRVVKCGVVFALLAFGLESRAEQGVGAARLHPIDQSGVSGRILFLDSGSADTGLVVSGAADGLDPAQTYVSLIYDAGALPGGPAACAPVTGALTRSQMLLGFWVVAADGTGRLFVQKAGESYAGLRDIGAVSIRVVLGPPPSGFVLQSCGRVHPTGRAVPK